MKPLSALLAAACVHIAGSVTLSKSWDQDVNDLLCTLSAPGVIIQRPPVISTTPQTTQTQKYMKLSRVPHDKVAHGFSAASILAKLQLDTGDAGIGNISTVDERGVQYSVDVLLNGSSMKVVLDTTSADTWVRGSNFTCLTPSNEYNDCGLGPAYPSDGFSHGQLRHQHFYVTSKNGKSIGGQLGYMDVELGGFTVKDQEIGLATQGTWQGDNVTSGVLGMAYPALTSAYEGDNVTDNDPNLALQYSPLFTSMVTDGLIDAYWVLAIFRNSSEGMFSLGGYPPINLTDSVHVTTPMLIANLANKSTTGFQPSFYTLVPTGFMLDTQKDDARYPFIIDSATSQTYVPPHIADEVHNRFNPPATYLWYYGAYYSDCDAIPPRFAIMLNGSPFFISPEDMINQAEVDPLTGLCQTGVNSGDNGPYILGLSWLMSQVVAFEVGPSTITVYSHERYES